MSVNTDVAIIGAGFAGLAAARILAEQGLRVVVIEARERVGGRAHTIHPEASLPAELGPEYVHGEPPVTIDLLHEAGLSREPIKDVHHGNRGGRIVEEPDVWARFGKFLAHAPPASRDESARDYLLRRRPSERDAYLFTTLIEGYYGAPIGDISIASIAADAGGAGDDGNPMSRVRGGYSGLALFLRDKCLAAGAEIRYGHVVRTVDWSAARVRIDYQVGDLVASVVAKRAIVTVPLGVLIRSGDDGVRFQPALGEHGRAMSRLGMGQVVKVVTCFAEPVWEDYSPAALRFVHANPGATFPVYWLRSRGDAHQMSAWVGGPAAEQLAGCHDDELLERALRDFAATVGMPMPVLESAVDHHHFHDYAADPFSRGAYSYTRVGGGNAAAQLATPLGDVLYFAGEATEYDYEGSVAGALISGQRAAHQIVDRLRARRAA